ncbi:hypothetical protein VNI00_012513 [Paramarasmius palmivorus]|uniref:RNA-dependent RNA polymerase n=1 Tax=Paramarasmius palmivorus TaxID=297713 RepID=A0AAW0C657_9AGAR
MDLNIRYLPSDINDWELTRIIQKILHDDEFLPRSDPDERRINFRAKVNPSPVGGVRNDGTGVLTIPHVHIGFKFLDWIHKNPVKIGGKKIKFYKRNEPPLHWLVMTLQRTPFVDPNIEEEYAEKIFALDDKLRVDVVQFGIFFKSPGAGSVREYSIEWQNDYTRSSTAWLKFEYDHKLIRVMLGNPMTEETGYSVAISFASIQKIGVGYDPGAYICFDTLTPPVFEREEFHRTLSGDDRQDNKKYKHRVGSLHPGHERVAPYCQKLRLILYDKGEQDVIDRFCRLCKIAGIADSLVIKLPRTSNIIAASHALFDGRKLYNLRAHFTKFDWSVAFQLEALLYNCLLHTEEMKQLLSRIQGMYERHPDDHQYVAGILRDYGTALRDRPPSENPFKRLENVQANFFPGQLKLARGSFNCYHVTFAPTRMILEGPYPTQSNRVIRRYEGFEHHFIRVDFRDEDRLQYRWDREVDGSTFLDERVGGILKNGFELGGRRFEFLAYSSSALREHAVWFISPFFHPTEGFVNGDSVRDSVGDFKNINEDDYIGEDARFYEKDAKLLRQPSKFAARIALAFTATDPSVSIRRDQWEMVEDLGDNPDYLATDGVGTISESLADEIWDALCKDRPEWYRLRFARPSAYQIRFLGFKGMVSVDKQLDKDGGNIRMRLRPSMRKFGNRSVVVADIEIARAFERPNKSYLNRPLVTILEDRQVKKQAFTDLLDLAVAEVSKFMRDHSLGTSYNVPWMLKQLHQYGAYIGTEAPSKSSINIDNPFLKQLRQVGRMDVLREIKHSARIPIPDSFLLVGVADEGPAYEKMGYENVFSLPEGHIFGSLPVWGPFGTDRRAGVRFRAVLSSIQEMYKPVHAIGKPPADKLCLFAHMKNVVVLPSVGQLDPAITYSFTANNLAGDRSLASKLGGGDLDGDLYDIITYPELQPPLVTKAAKYEPGDTLTLDRNSNVEDICDFVVKYISSDVLGLLSDRLLVIADQAKRGIFDRDCEKLARLCSQAVDYPKNGIPVDLDKDKLPSALIRCKPDWHAAEVVDPRGTDYYLSTRALGEMYRKVTLAEPEEIALTLDGSTRWDTISGILAPKIVSYVGLLPQLNLRTNEDDDEIPRLFCRYRDELRYICATHTLSNTPGVTLLEAEVVMGTILAKCSQKRWRKDRIWRMRNHAGTLVNEVRRVLSSSSSVSATTSFDSPSTPLEDQEDQGPMQTRPQATQRLVKSWKAWTFALDQALEEEEAKRFGANSFALVALDSVLHALEVLEVLDGQEGIIREVGMESERKEKEKESEEEPEEQWEKPGSRKGRGGANGKKGSRPNGHGAGGATNGRRGKSGPQKTSNGRGKSSKQ